jgi:hypothetical protein
MGAAKEVALVLHAVADDLAAAVDAGGRQRVHGALEAVKGMGLAVHFDGESLVVLVSTNVAASHGSCSYF